MSDQATKLSKKTLCDAVGLAMDKVRGQAPRIHCLTNAVALEFSANTLLAIGAEPSMTSSAEEVGSFVETCGALVINLGMLDSERRRSVMIALDAAQTNGRPWVLDPAYAQISPIRLTFAKSLLPRKPKIIRANRMEIASLSENRGAAELALSIGGSVAATSEVDLVTDGVREVQIANGDPMMARVTAVGCVTSCLTGAFLAVEPDHFMAAAIAITIADIAGEMAVEMAQGPGSFRVSFLDSLAALTPETIEARVKLI
ncbi:MAG: hydroxyethylthiazole kinase [Fimbriimonadaceae bacterium]|nr:hydroxyethylthiazole kinase [Alphaproteobacteria bacterium]